MIACTVDDDAIAEAMGATIERRDTPCLPASDIDRIEAAHNKQCLKRERWRRFCAMRDLPPAVCRVCRGSGTIVYGDGGCGDPKCGRYGKPTACACANWPYGYTEACDACKGTGERTK